MKDFSPQNCYNMCFVQLLDLYFCNILFTYYATGITFPVIVTAQYSDLTLFML